MEISEKMLKFNNSKIQKIKNSRNSKYLEITKKKSKI
jgi:hypothetical protein